MTVAVGFERCWGGEAGAGFDLAVEASVVEPVDVGEVGDPQPVRCRRTELALDETGGPVEALIAFGGPDPDQTTAAALQAHVGHQPFDGATRDADAVFVQLVPHLVRAVDRKVLFPHPQLLWAQLAVTDRPR